MLINKLNEIKTNIRWKDWGIDKIPVLFSICFYLIFINGRSAQTNISDFFVFLFFSVVSTLYGFGINDYADLEIDRIHGKRNIFFYLSGYKKNIVLIMLSLFVLVSGLYFIRKPYFIVLWIIQLFIATFYSLPPIRFKERGTIGLIIPFFAQLVLPTLICFSIFGEVFSLVCLYFLIYSIFKGGAYDIGHQFHDHILDSKTNTTTFAVKHGKKIVLYLFNIFLVLERIFFLFILIMLLNTIRIDLQSFYFNPFFIALSIDIILLILVFMEEIRKKSVVDPYFDDIRGLGNILHVIFPNVIFPLLILFALFFNDKYYLALLVFFIIWIFPTPQKVLWPLRTFWQVAKKIIPVR